MPKILVNDGLHPAGIQMLEDKGYEVDTNKIAQDDLLSKLPEYDGICVRSATKVRKPLIEACPNLKFVGRGGVGLDNIDVDFAKSKGVAVLNTPAASSRSVAELVFGHLLSLCRSIYDSNRSMPIKGQSDFKNLKKKYSKGVEIEGKTLGIIGLGRIGQETAKIAFGMGMNVIGMDIAAPSSVPVSLTIGNQEVSLSIENMEVEKVLAKADFLSLHIPFTGTPILGAKEFEIAKEGMIIVNASRGGTIDETALLDALNSRKIYAAGLDVFENEPTPRMEILEHPYISLTPHIGASTLEAQEKIGVELASKIVEVLG